VRRTVSRHAGGRRKLPRDAGSSSRLARTVLGGLSARRSPKRQPLQGPALVAEDDTTTVVPAGFSAVVTRRGTYCCGVTPQAEKAMRDTKLVRQIQWNRCSRSSRSRRRPAAYVVQHYRARVRRPLRGRLRCARPHARPGSHGNAGHVNTMAESVGHFCTWLPPARMAPATCTSRTIRGKAPAISTTSCHDSGLSSQAPGRILAATSHVMDIGGLGFGPDGRDLYMEGLSGRS